MCGIDSVCAVRLYDYDDDDDVSSIKTNDERKCYTVI